MRDWLWTLGTAAVVAVAIFTPWSAIKSWVEDNFAVIGLILVVILTLVGEAAGDRR